MPPKNKNQTPASASSRASSSRRAAPAGVWKDSGGSWHLPDGSLLSVLDENNRPRQNLNSAEVFRLVYLLPVSQILGLRLLEYGAQRWEPAQTGKTPPRGDEQMLVDLQGMEIEDFKSGELFKQPPWNAKAKTPPPSFTERLLTQDEEYRSGLEAVRGQVEGWLATREKKLGMKPAPAHDEDLACLLQEAGAMAAKPVANFSEALMLAIEEQEKNEKEATKSSRIAEAAGRLVEFEQYMAARIFWQTLLAALQPGMRLEQVARLNVPVCQWMAKTESSARAKLLDVAARRIGLLQEAALALASGKLQRDMPRSLAASAQSMGELHERERLAFVVGSALGKMQAAVSADTGLELAAWAKKMMQIQQTAPDEKARQKAGQKLLTLLQLAAKGVAQKEVDALMRA